MCPPIFLMTHVQYMYPINAHQFPCMTHVPHQSSFMTHVLYTVCPPISLYDTCTHVHVPYKMCPPITLLWHMYTLQSVPTNLSLDTAFPSELSKYTQTCCRPRKNSPPRIPALPAVGSAWGKFLFYLFPAPNSILASSTKMTATNFAQILKSEHNILRVPSSHKPNEHTS